VGSQTVGYRYFMGIFFGICHGPVDALRRIVWGDRTAWAGDQAESGTISVNEPQLFGGDEREGGIAGVAHLMMGGQTQTLPSAVAALLPSPAPAFRGVLGLLYDGQITANNPYVKPIGFKVQRILAGWNTTVWYPEKAPIGEIVPGATALTLLQTRFSGGLADDESSYARGAPEQNGGIVEEGRFRVDRNNDADPNKPSLLTWNGVQPDGAAAVTFEAFVQYDLTPNVSATSMLEVQINPADPGTIYSVMWYGPLGHLKVKNGFNEWISGPPVLDKVHVALVFTATEFRAYVDGDLVMTLPRTEVPVTAMRVRIGDWTGYSSAVTRYSVFGFRVRNAELYTGSSFTPPTEIPAPDAAGTSTGDLLMNPAHIIYQCLTDPVWGMGCPTALIGSSFTAAADALYAEDFGLCMLWNKPEEIGAFVNLVCDHIGAVLYTDPKTGLWEIRLLRADYDVGDLQIVTETEGVEIESFQRPGYADTINEVTVKFREVATNRDASLTVQNLANVQAQAGVVSTTREYPGLPNEALALRVAQRDLIVMSTPLAKGRIRVNRSGWSLVPGDVFRLQWPKLGIADVVVRILGVDTGSLRDGKITLDIAEDVFGLPASSYAAQEPAGWQEPTITAQPITLQDVVEAPYLSIALEVTAAELAAVDPDTSYLSALAARPSSSAIGFEIYSRVGSAAYADRIGGVFVPYAELDGAITHTTTTIPIAAGVDLDEVEAGSLAIIGTGRSAEWVRVDSVATDGTSMTVARGMLDTVPAAHADGAAVWFDDARSAPERIERATGEEVDFKLLTRTTSGLLPLGQAAAVSGQGDQRQVRPYPPGLLKIDGAAYPASASDALTITWAHRDRLQQTAGLIEQSAANIGPEAGTTYAAELRNAGTNVLVASASGLDGTTWSPEIQQAGSYNMRLQLWSVRGGVESWQRHDYTFAYTGAGLSIEAPGRTGTVAASLVFPASAIGIAIATTQSAQAARPATGWQSRIVGANLAGGTTVSAGAALSIFFTRYYSVGGAPFADVTTISHLVPAPTPISSVLSTLRTLIQAETALAGWNASVVTASPGVEYLEVLGPVGASWYVDPLPPSAGVWGLQQTILGQGGPAIPVDIPQIIAATLSGTPTTGDRVTLTLAGTTFSYTVTGSDTLTTIASALASIVGASASYDGSSAGAVATITGVGATAFHAAGAAEGARAFGNVDPLAPDPYFGNVELLLHGDGTDGATGFVDSSSHARAVTAISTAQHDTAQKVFGASSIYLPATSARLEVPNGTHFYFTGDFTVEAYVRPSTVASFQNIVIQGGDSGAWWLRITNTGLLAFGSVGGSDEVTSGSTALTAGVFTHVAMARAGSTLRLFVGGALVNTLTRASNVGNGSPTMPLSISGQGFNLNDAHVDEVRITKGVARYTASFTPLPFAYPNY